jgi:hypothetical protein
LVCLAPNFLSIEVPAAAEGLSRCFTGTEPNSNELMDVLEGVINAGDVVGAFVGSLLHPVINVSEITSWRALSLY